MLVPLACRVSEVLAQRAGRRSGPDKGVLSKVLPPYMYYTPVSRSLTVNLDIAGPARTPELPGSRRTCPSSGGENSDAQTIDLPCRARPRRFWAAFRSFGDAHSHVQIDGRSHSGLSAHRQHP